MNLCGPMAKRAVGCSCSGLLLMLATVWPRTLQAGDWPTYRHDNARSGVTAEPLADAADAVLGLPASARAAAGLGRAESAAGRRLVRADRAAPSPLRRRLSCGGVRRCRLLRLLRRRQGRVPWTRTTGRRAMEHAHGRSRAAGADGLAGQGVRRLGRRLRLLPAAGDGGEQWKFRAAPSERKVLGSGKMISLWPVRTGVLVDDGTAYFGAGIFPAEGVAMYAVNAEDGKLIWCNDCLRRRAPEPHVAAGLSAGLEEPPVRSAGPRVAGGVRPPGWTTAVRSLRRTHHRRNVRHAGRRPTVHRHRADDRLRPGVSHAAQSSWFWGQQLIVTPDAFYVGDRARAVRGQTRRPMRPPACAARACWIANAISTRKSKRAKRGPEAALQDSCRRRLDAVNQQFKETESRIAAGEMWRVPCDCAETLVLAGNVLLAGGDRKVLAFDAASGEVLWTGEVDGKARGLAVADGRLFVSSDTGAIYCFGPEGSRRPMAWCSSRSTPSPFPADELTPVFEAAAEHIVRTTGIKRGYCLVLGCGTGRLAFELAKRTELQICGIEPDLQKVQAARRALDAAGLYGARVVGRARRPDAGSVLRLLREPGGFGRRDRVGPDARRRAGSVPHAEAAGRHDLHRPACGRRRQGQAAGGGGACGNGWPRRGSTAGRVSEENGVWLDVPSRAAAGRGQLDPSIRRTGQHDVQRRRTGPLPAGRAVVWQTRADVRWPSGTSGPRRRWPSTAACSSWAKALPTGSAWARTASWPTTPTTD